jgi:hypothetical protein
MNNKSILKVSVCLIATAFLSGCASYRAIPLNNLSSEQSSFQFFQPDIVLAAKAFSKRDCKKYLDRDVIGKGYIPVQISLDNRSNKNYLFSPSRVSLPCANPEEVAAKVHTSTIARAAGYGAAALVFWPFAIPAIVDGVSSAQANEALDQDFYLKAGKDQIIAPYSHANMVIFIPKESYHPVFNVTLVDVKSNQPREFTVRVGRI